jgi:predicted CoA-binding protein
MTTRAAIDDFLKQKTLAIIGFSRGGKKFGNMCSKELKAREYRLFPINPNVETIQGERCCTNLSALPQPVGGVLLVVPPVETEKVVKDIASSGIQRVWMQRGAASEKAIRFCEENGIQVVHGECILMYAEPLVFFPQGASICTQALGQNAKVKEMLSRGNS